MSKIKNIVFDIGSVLLHYRWKYMLMDYGLSEADAIRVGGLMFDDPDKLWSIFDLGDLTQEEIICAYEKKHPKDAAAIRWFISHAEFMHVPRPRVYALLPELKAAGYKLYILSNYPKEMFEKHTEYADFIPLMDGAMVSYTIHKAKPDPAIYQALCDKYGLKKEECLFFDDREENVEGAIAFGMSSKQVLSQEGLIEDIEKILAEGHI